MSNRYTLYADAPTKVDDVHVFASRSRWSWHVRLIVHRDGLERRGVFANFSTLTVGENRYRIHVMPRALRAIAVLVPD